MKFLDQNFIRSVLFAIIRCFLLMFLRIWHSLAYMELINVSRPIHCHCVMFRIFAWQKNEIKRITTNELTLITYRYLLRYDHLAFITHFSCKFRVYMYSTWRRNGKAVDTECNFLNAKTCRLPEHSNFLWNSGNLRIRLACSKWLSS